MPGLLIRAGALTALVLLLSSCASVTPNYDTRFGEAVRMARHQMTINPDAGRDADPVAGIDGKAAEHAVTQYQNTFRTPPPVTNVINIGGSIGGAPTR